MADLYFGGSVWCNIDVALRRLEPIYKQEAELLGLSIMEWHVLRVLYKQDKQMVRELAQAVGRAQTAFTPMLDHIESKGLIERCPHPTDRRAVIIQLTAQAKALEGQVKASAERIEDNLRRKFLEKEWREYEAVVADLQTMRP